MSERTPDSERRRQAIFGGMWLASGPCLIAYGLGVNGFVAAGCFPVLMTIVALCILYVYRKAEDEDA